MLAALRRTYAHLVHILYTELSTAVSPLPPLPWVPSLIRCIPPATLRNRIVRLPPRRARYQEASRLVDAPRSLCENTLMESRTDRAGVALSYPWIVRAPLSSIASLRSAPHARPTQISGYRVAHVYDIRFVLLRMRCLSAPPARRLPHSMNAAHRLHHIRTVHQSDPLS